MRNFEKALGISAIIANSFGSIYERNAINAALPIVTIDDKISELAIKDGDKIIGVFYTPIYNNGANIKNWSLAIPDVDFNDRCIEYRKKVR